MFDNPEVLLIIGLLMSTALAVLFAENVGIINIGIEGQLVAGIFGYTVLGFLTKDAGWNDDYLKVLRFVLSVICAWICVILATSLFGFFVIELRMDQILVGIAFNIIFTALATFGVYTLGNGDPFNGGPANEFVEFRSSFPLVLFAIFLLFVSLPLIYNFFFKTKPGIRIRAIGKNANAVKITGINLNYYRYLSLFLATFFVTLAAIFFIQYQSLFNGSARGYGYLGLAILLLSNRRLMLILFFSSFFAFLYQIANQLAVTNFDWEWLNDNKNSFTELLLSFNFIIPLFVMIGYGAIKRYRLNSIRAQKQKPKTPLRPNHQKN